MQYVLQRKLKHFVGRDVGFSRNTSNDQVTHIAQTDQSVRKELRQLQDEIQNSLKDLEKKISSVVSEKETQKSGNSTNFNRQGNFPFKCHHCGRKGHMIKDCFVKNKQGETKMQMLDSKSSTRLQENQDSHQKTGSIVSSTIAMKGDQEIKESRLFISAMVNGVQCTLL